jgi:putative PIN family toxin of toxin-antitoxin system
MRLVLDTNVLISALFWDGNERKLLLDCKKKKHKLIISPEILEEMNRILDVKFDVPSEIRIKYEQNILRISEIVFPKGEIRVVNEHPADNVIIETAILGKADKLITGDKHLLNLRTVEGIKIDKSSRV